MSAPEIRPPTAGPKQSGPIAWMARNSVAANLLMAVFLLGGLAMTGKVKQEVFPEFTLDLVNVNVAYPGASPQEVETGILLILEEAVRGLDGVKTVTANALEGIGSLNVELIEGTDRDRALADVKTAVDRVVNFPEDAERPQVSLLAIRSRVISLILFGEVSEEALRTLAERLRDDLLGRDGITQIELTGTRPREISIEVPEARLRSHGLTLDGIAQAVRASSIELPGGVMKTPAGELLLRTSERRDLGHEFGELTLRTDGQGVRLQVEDIAQVEDGFQEVDIQASFKGIRAVQLDVYRVGEQTPTAIAESVKDFVAENSAALPPGVQIETWNDRSEILEERMDLLLRNAFLGLILVFVALGLFLEVGLAFWVMLGIPISFLGAFLLMPAMDVSVNMISLFAFIVTLGIVVDDAIVVGENIYEHRKKGLSYQDAAIMGAQRVGIPVVFAILTTVAAFSPLFFVPGASGKFFRVIPAIVIAVILVSLLESLFILPAHLAHAKPPRTKGVRGFINRQQSKVARGLEWFIDNIYVPVARACVRRRYLTAAVGSAVLLTAFGYLAGGHIDFSFMPRVEGDTVTVNAQLAVGSPIAETQVIHDRLVQAAEEVIEENGGDISRGYYSIVGQSMAGGGGPRGGSSSDGSNLAGAQVRLVPSDQRTLTSFQFSQQWRKKVENLAGIEKILFDSTLGAAGGSAIDILLTHPDTSTLERAAGNLALSLRDYSGVRDIDNGFAGGKKQLDLTLTAVGRGLGMTETDLARQIRSAFFGAEAVRQQRGRDEVRVMVRLPREARRSLESFESLILRTPAGGDVPLAEVADVKEGRAYTRIEREDGRRVLHVTADVDESAGNAEKILARVGTEVMPSLAADFPNLKFSFEGQRRDRQETSDSLKFGFPLALFAIFALLAVPFKSYTQPLLIMAAIPFGMVGALIGHVAMGFEMSIISIFGIVALAGIVVNDSLVLVVRINEYRDEDDMPVVQAVVEGGRRRFRPILLTSLTTFFGLVPMIFETSVQARFLVPMAISIGFGVMFATFVILLLVPAGYMILDDAQKRVARIKAYLSDDEEEAAAELIADPATAATSSSSG